MRESLEKQPSPIVCEEIFSPAIEEDRRRSFPNMVRLNLAHVLMLERQGIIPVSQAGKLAQLMEELYGTDGSSIGSDPLKEDYYFNFEQYVISRCGMEAGGAMHTARSRNDLNSTLIRMNVREELFALQEKLERLIRAVLQLAGEHTDTVMTGYTHMQPAQPITLAHYLTGISQGLCRDLERLSRAYEALNLLPLGGCAFAGTSFPIDRGYTAGMLGFAGVLCNTIDSVASRDYLLEIIADCTILGTTLSRFAGDLYIWCTDEFGYLAVDDSLACCSSIMPQKRNPLALEHAKSKAAHLLGAFVDLAAVLRGTPYGHCRDLSEMLAPFWKGTGEMRTVLDLLTAAVASMHVKDQEMKGRADGNYSTVTELADALVKDKGLAFREAHRLVGNLVRECVGEGLPATAITAELLEREFQVEFGHPCGWTEEQVRGLLDGAASVRSRISQGSPAPEQCRQMIEQQRRNVETKEEERRHRQDEIRRAYDSLFHLGRELAGQCTK